MKFNGSIAWRSVYPMEFFLQLLGFEIISGSYYPLEHWRRLESFSSTRGFWNIDKSSEWP